MLWKVLAASQSDLMLHLHTFRDKELYLAKISVSECFITCDKYIHGYSWRLFFLLSNRDKTRFLIWHNFLHAYILSVEQLVAFLLSFGKAIIISCSYFLQHSFYVLAANMK